MYDRKLKFNMAHLILNINKLYLGTSVTTPTLLSLFFMHVFLPNSVAIQLSVEGILKYTIDIKLNVYYRRKIYLRKLIAEKKLESGVLPKRGFRRMAAE